MAADIFLDSVHDIVRKEGVRSAEAEVPKAASVGVLEVRLLVCLFVRVRDVCVCVNVCVCVMCVCA